MTNDAAAGPFNAYEDTWLIDGVRTPFVDYNGALALVSPTDLGIKAARAVFERTGVSPADVGAVVAGCVAPASFDAFMLPRHIGLYAGVPLERPALLVQRVCGTGVEAICQAADAIALGKIELGLCAGAESSTRTPIASFTHRGGFRLGQPVEFKDFLWEALTDTASGVSMGGTAEKVAELYGITREDVDRFAALSFSRAAAAQESGFLTGEIVPLVNETFELSGYRPRGIALPRSVECLDRDTHVRPSPYEALAKLRPAFGGVQTGGNSSALVDGGAAALVGAGAFVRSNGLQPLARLVAAATVGVPPEIMSMGPVPAVRRLLAGVGLTLDAIDRFEVNEAYAAQVVGVERELGLDRSRLNVNGGAIALGHPLAATGVRLAVTLARELRRAGLRRGIVAVCIGGGQGIALLIENPD